MFEVINFLSKNLRRFSYTKDFCSLHIHGLYLYNTQGFIANKKTMKNKENRLNFLLMTRNYIVILVSLHLFFVKHAFSARKNV